jgi:putative ABC transport system permease protein
MTWRELAARLKGALGLNDRAGDRDLQAELAFHREQLESRHRADGLDAAEARRRAAIALGGGAQIAEAWRDQHGLPFFDTLGQDVRYGLRILRRAPGFTLAALVTLALGIGANTAIFSVVDGILLRALPYADPDRLVTVGDREADGTSSNVGFATVVDWAERSRTFDTFAVMRSWMPTLITPSTAFGVGDAERLSGVRVSWNYFDLLGVRPLLGRTFERNDDRPEDWFSVVLSERLWRRRFGADASIVGRTITLNDRPFRVLGVMPDTFQPLDAERYYHAAPQVWAALGYDAKSSAASGACRSCQHLRAFGRLRPGVSLASATAEMNAIRARLRKEHPTDYDSGSIAVVPLREALTGSARAALLVLLAAVAFILLMACANVASLQLARAVTRQRELALRAALGAGRGRVIRQLLTESLMLAGAGGLAGVFVARVLVNGLVAFAPTSLPRLDRIAVDGRVLAFTAVLAVLAGVLFGLAPAGHTMTEGRDRGLLIDQRGTVAGRSRARMLLIVLDFALALVLLAGAGLMLRTVAAMTRTDPGFRAEGLMSLQFSLAGSAFPTEESLIAFQKRALERLRVLPGVESAALAGQIPFGGVQDCWGFHAQGHMRPSTADDPCVDRYSFTGDYLRVMGISLLAGRTLTDADNETAARVILVSQATAKLVWGNGNPIGAQVRIGANSGSWRTVVGIVADVHHDDLTLPPAPAMYTPEPQIPSAYLTAVMRATGAGLPALASAARATIADLNPSVPVYGGEPVSVLVARSTADRVFVMRLLVGFAMLALLLAAVGLYAVVSYTVSQRAREVGVRVALGARPADITRVVLGGGLPMVGLGVAGGLIMALAGTRLLGSLVYGVSVTDTVTLVSAAALLTAIALLAHAVPLRRALRIDPASALRTE